MVRFVQGNRAEETGGITCHTKTLCNGAKRMPEGPHNTENAIQKGSGIRFSAVPNDGERPRGGGRKRGVGATPSMAPLGSTVGSVKRSSGPSEVSA